MKAKNVSRETFCLKHWFLGEIKKLFFVLLFLLAFAHPSAAEQWFHTEAIAMHGAPKFDSGFKNFDYARSDAPKGGTLRLNITGSFDSLNPFIVKGTSAEGMTYVYESLMARSQDEPFTLYPLIAEKIDVKPDRSAIRFHIDRRARWQDGVPLTAADVLFSWETLKNKGRPNHRSYYSKVAKAELSGNAVTFTFKPNEDGSIDREMPLIIGLMPVLPKHIWEKKPFEETSLQPPIGSGPYRITEVQPGRATVFTRDKNYWGRDLPARIGHCNFDTIRYDYYRDENVAQEAFTAHQVDARRETDPKRWAELQRMSKEKNGVFRTLILPHRRTEPARGFIMNTRRPLFADIRVRKALGLAFDGEWINRVLFHGSYKRIHSVFANSELAASGLPSEAEKALLKPFEKDLSPGLLTTPVDTAEPQSPEAFREQLLQAAKLLEEAGYRVANGVVKNQKGEAFIFGILLSDPQDEKIALEYARGLAKLGISAQVRTVDAAQFQARLNDFDYDMVLFRWVNSLSPGNEQAFYWGSQAADTQGSRNYAGVKSAAVDDLVRKITSAATREELVTAAHALDRVLMSGHYFVPLFYRGTDWFAVWKNIAVPEQTPLYGVVVESWYAAMPQNKGNQ